MPEWEGFKKQGEWQLRQRGPVKEERFQEFNSQLGLSTTWIRELNTTPQICTRLDQYALGSRKIEGFHNSAIDPYQPDLLRCHMERATGKAGDFLVESLSINSTGRIWRSNDFDERGFRSRIETQYGESGDISQIGLYSIGKEPNDYKSYDTTFSFVYDSSGTIQKIHYRTRSKHVDLPENTFENLQAGKVITMKIDMEKSKGTTLTEGTGEVGIVFNFFGTIFYVIDETPGKNIISLRIRQASDESSFNMTRKVDNGISSLEDGINAKTPQEWESLIEKVRLSRG